MRFEIRYPTGAQHEVELSGTVAVLGRDPSCDLVVNDPKCSRRHAVLEAGPDGIAVRDAGSANGVYVNGKKVERAQLVVGDTLRLGEVILKVLDEDVPGTLVMAPEDMDDLSGARTPHPAKARPAPVAAPPAAVPRAAPPAPVKPPPPVVAAPPPPAPPRPAPPRAAVPAPPPRVEPRRPPPTASPAAKPGGSGKTLLIVGAIGCLVVLLLTAAGIAAAIFLPRYLRSRMAGALDGAVCVARMRAVAAAEDAFRTGTCGSYADLDGLTNPAAVIPHYPASGPAFLGPELASPEANGCRFELKVDEPVPPSDGCPKRSFRRYAYSAAPTGGGSRYFLISSDGIIRAAEGRPATPDDPPVQ